MNYQRSVWQTVCGSCQKMTIQFGRFDVSRANKNYVNMRSAQKKWSKSMAIASNTWLLRPMYIDCVQYMAIASGFFDVIKYVSKTWKLLEKHMNCVCTWRPIRLFFHYSFFVIYHPIKISLFPISRSYLVYS